MATEVADSGQLASSSVSSDGGTTYRAARIVAVVAGLLGALLAIATPLAATHTPRVTAVSGCG